MSILLMIYELTQHRSNLSYVNNTKRNDTFYLKREEKSCH